MKPLVFSSTASLIDADTKKLNGLSDDMLMESAADKLYTAIKSLPAWERVVAGGALVAVCGKGNNAGDALAIVRKAAFDGHHSVFALVAAGLNEVARKRLEEARAAGVRIVAFDSPEADAVLQGAVMLLDGIAGTGIKGQLRPPFDSLASRMTAGGGTVVALDVPSGTGLGSSLDAPVVKADHTLSLAPVKLELYLPGLRANAGIIHEIGGVFPANCAAESEAVLLTKDSLPYLLPELAPDAYKGKRGALGIYAGAVGSTGAACLAAQAGSASGAGTVSVMCRDEIWPILAASLSAQMARPLSMGPGRNFTAVLAGPGWGMDSETSALLSELLASAMPLVLDADALRMLAAADKAPPRQAGVPLVLTPHLGEFADLATRVAGWEDGENLPKSERLTRATNSALFDTPAILRQCAVFFNAVVVLKNHVTWISAPDGRLAVWDGQEPTLGTGGSGDVLAGLVAGLLARGATAFEAACAAVIAHGLAGREAAEDCGFYDASILPAYIARILYRETVRGNKG